MLTLYRGIWIVLLHDAALTAELTEVRTGHPLPTSAGASLEEGAVVYLGRAKVVVDRYKDGLCGMAVMQGRSRMTQDL